MSEAIPARVSAMIEQCHNRHPTGACECPAGECRAARELRDIKRELESQLKSVQGQLDYVSAPPCTVIDGWKMPEPPDLTSGWEPVAELDMGEWNMQWEDETGDTRDMECPWPFNEQHAYATDFQNLGFATRIY